MNDNKSIIERLPSLDDIVEYSYWGKVKTGRITEIKNKRLKISGVVSNENWNISMQWHNWIHENHVIKIITNE